MLFLCVSFQEVHSSAMEVEEYYFTKHEDLIFEMYADSLCYSFCHHKT